MSSLYNSSDDAAFLGSTHRHKAASHSHVHLKPHVDSQQPQLSESPRSRGSAWGRAETVYVWECVCVCVLYTTPHPPFLLLHSHGAELTRVNEGWSEIEPEPQITPGVNSVTSTRRNSDAHLVLGTVKFTQLITILDLYCRICRRLWFVPETMRHIVWQQPPQSFLLLQEVKRERTKYAASLFVGSVSGAFKNMF